MKGYYRAVKSGVDWAVKIDRIKDPFIKMMALMYRTIEFEKKAVYSNPFLELISKEPMNLGAYLPIPIMFFIRKRAQYRFEKSNGFG